jgi:hypothetical protein
MTFSPPPVNSVEIGRVRRIQEGKAVQFAPADYSTCTNDST